MPHLRRRTTIDEVCCAANSLNIRHDIEPTSEKFMHHRTHTQDTPWHPVKRDVAGIDLCGKGPVWNDVSLGQRVVNVANGPEMHTVAPRSATALKDTAPEQQNRATSRVPRKQNFAIAERSPGTLNNPGGFGEKQARGNPTATPDVKVRQPNPSE